MQVNWTGFAVLLSVLALLVTMLFMFLRKRKIRSIAQMRVVSQPEVKALEEKVPERIVIGENPDQPVLTIEALPSTHKYELAKPLDAQSGTSISRLSALCQALPALLVAGESSGKRLMEVVINGDLVRAADGNGLRAFTMTTDGIKQHARLYEVSNLQNAAAFWQIASVVVAQKHLADISKKLDEIKDGVHGISMFLDNQRKSRIRSIYAYLGQVYQAIQGGELPGAARNQLDSCEIDLLEIQHHLEMEYRQKVDKKIEHKELLGTEDLTADITKKITELDLLAEDIAFCIKSRIAAWHVLSLFPGDPQLKIARRVSIQKSIELFQSLGPYCEKNIKHEISGVDARSNFADTLKKRKRALTKKCDSTVRMVAHRSQQGVEAMERSDQIMLANDLPTRILIQFDNGKFIGARHG